MQNFLNPEYLIENPWILALILIWTLPWKGVALWRAAKSGHLYWFMALLVINLLALPEIVYIFWFSEKSSQKKSQQ